MFSYSSFLFQNHLSQNTNLSLHFQFLPQPEPDCKAYHKQHFSLSFQIIQRIHRFSVVHQLEIYVISLNRIVFGRLCHISEYRIFCHILLLRHLNIFEQSGSRSSCRTRTFLQWNRSLKLAGPGQCNSRLQHGFDHLFSDARSIQMQSGAHYPGRCE